MTKKLKYRPSIYLRAAKRIETGQSRLCCVALIMANSTLEEDVFFMSKYKPPGNYNWWFGTPKIKANQRKRINALKRMAKLAEKENRK